MSFHLLGMITDHHRNLGRFGKIETLPILQICARSSRTIGDIYDFEFSLVGQIWDGGETVKSQTIWDFPDMKSRLKNYDPVKTRLSESEAEAEELANRKARNRTLSLVYSSASACDSDNAVFT